MSGRLAFGANQRPLAKPTQETECDMLQPPNSRPSGGGTICTNAKTANDEVMKLDSRQQHYSPTISTKKERNTSPCQYNSNNNNNTQPWPQRSPEHGQPEQEQSRPTDQVVPNWPAMPDSAKARRDSVMAGDEEIQYKICSLKDYSQISSLDNQAAGVTSNNNTAGFSPTKQLVKSLSQDRKMVGLQAKRMSECIYTSNSRRMVPPTNAAAAADETISSSSKATTDSSATQRTTSRPQQMLGAESKIERVRKLFVAPLSLRPISGKQQQQQQPTHSQTIGVAASSSDVLASTSKQQRHRSPMRQKGGKSFRVYGCPLHLANNIYPITCFGRPDIYKQQSVPYILARLCNYIEENSSQLTHEGIFRVNGNARLMGKLRTLFDHLGDAPLESESVDVATSASMLKMYLRELPEPLIPARMNYYFITLAKKYSVCLNTTTDSPETTSGGNGEAHQSTPPTAPGGHQQQQQEAFNNRTTGSSSTVGAQTSGRRNSAVKERQHSAFSRDLIKLVRKLPIENYNLLKYLACFLHRISLKQEHNKMCAQALGIVFGPNVFRVRSESFKGLKEQELSNKIMSSIISNYRCIFDSELTDPLGNLVSDVCTGSRLDETGGPEVDKLPSSNFGPARRPSSGGEEFPSDDTLLRMPADELVRHPELSRKGSHDPQQQQQDNMLDSSQLSSTTISAEPPKEPINNNDISETPAERCLEDAEADEYHPEDEEESYTISSGSESYCSSDFSQSLASSYDDDNNDDDDEEEETNEDEDEEEQRGARSRRTYLNRKHISSSECRSDTSYTPTSSHSEGAEEGQEDWLTERCLEGASSERRGSCAACTCREPVYHPQTSSNSTTTTTTTIATTTTARSVSSKRMATCDKAFSSASGSLESRRLNKRCPMFQVQRADGSRKGRPAVGASASNSIISGAGLSLVGASNRAADSSSITQPAASRKSQQFLGALLRRRSSSASSLSRVRRQSRQRFSSREEQRVKLQKTRIRRARARGVNPSSASKRLVAIQQQQQQHRNSSSRNHIITPGEGSSAAAAAAARCISGSDRSYLAGDEVSSLAHTDEPESLVAQIPQQVDTVDHVAGLGSCNSDDNLVVSISGAVAGNGSRKLDRGACCHRDGPQMKGRRLGGGLSESMARGLSGCHSSGELESGEMMQYSLVSLLALPNTADSKCGASASSSPCAITESQSCPSSNMNELRLIHVGRLPTTTTTTDQQTTATEMYSWSDHLGLRGSYSGFRGGEDSLLSQMRANKALARQLKRLIRHAKMLGGFSHQMELLVGRIQPQSIQRHQTNHTPQEYNELTTQAWHVDYLSTLDLASEIEHQLDQWTQAASTTAPDEASCWAPDKRADNFSKLAGLLGACITKLNRRYESLKSICEHNLRNHSNCSNGRATGSATTLASRDRCRRRRRRLSSSDPSVSLVGALIEHGSGHRAPPRTSEPSLFVMQSSGSDTTHHHREAHVAAPRERSTSANSSYCCFGPLCPSEFVCKIEGQLAAKRRRAGRLVGLTEMSPVQLAGEKLELQKNLLRYEHWFGRPTDRLHIGLVGHIYERYRAVKQLQRATKQEQQLQQDSELPSRLGATIKLHRVRRGGAQRGAINCLKIGSLSGSPKRRPSALAPQSVAKASSVVVVGIWLLQLAAAAVAAGGSHAAAVPSGQRNDTTAQQLQSTSTPTPATTTPPETESSTSSELLLEGQWLTRVPRDKLCTLIWANQVNSLSLANNLISRLEDNTFVCLATSLRILNLQNNRLENLGEGAFNLLGQLQVLQLENNRLARLPSRRTLHPLRSLKHLNLAHNRIERLDSDALGPANGRLVSLDLRSNPVAQVSALALRHLTRLKTLSLSQWPAFQLQGPQWSHFEGLAELRFLHLDRTNLSGLPENLCMQSPKLASLVLKSNQLERVPELSNCHKLLQLDLSYNKLVGHLSGNFSAWPNLLDLYLSHNRLNVLHEHAFLGLKSLETLDLNHNQLASIHPLAFLPMRASLKHLNVAQNSQLDWLPGAGLEQLLTLQAYGNQLLRRLPKLAKAKTLRLTYAYHCCDYLSAQSASGGVHNTNRKRPMSLLSRLLELFGANNPAETSHTTTDGHTGELSAHHSAPPDQYNQHQPELTTSPQLNLTNLILWPKDGGAGGATFAQDQETLANLSRHQMRQLSLQMAASSGAANKHLQRPTTSELIDDHIETSCLPAPGPFLPCQDLFDTWWLRAGVWCVFVSGFAGNLLVIVVLGSARRSSTSSALSTIMWPAGHSKRHIDVPRFLVINLALADLLMALYLGILAMVDLSTLGEFKLYAIRWQRSAICQLAGFLGILSSELSVFILAIITLERNYAITNAVHLNRRLSLQKAVLIMLLGYAFALGMAVIPLGGQLADYRKYSICLPLELADPSSQAGSQSAWSQSSSSSRMYMSTLLSINTLSFLLLLGCYLRMYCAIRGSQAWNANDLRIAKRMSVLVITDFLCWMPIILAALMALTGRTLVDAEGVKALAIFVLPLNSIANPFLYAITTKKFKRELEQLTRRLGPLASCLTGAGQSRNQNGKETSLFKRAENGAHYSRHTHYQSNLLLEARKHRGVSPHQNKLAKKEAGRLAGAAGGADRAAINRQSMQPAVRVIATRHQLTQTTNLPNHQLNPNNTGYCYSCARLQLQAGSLRSTTALPNDEPPNEMPDDRHSPLPVTGVQQPRILLERPPESSLVESQQNSCSTLNSGRGLVEKAESAKGSVLLCQACSASSSPRQRSPDIGSVNLALPHGLALGNHQSDRELARQQTELEPRAPNRCASACANTTSGHLRLLHGNHLRPARQAAQACGSCDITGGQRVPSRSGGLSRLLLRPLAKAWSSIQISLAGSTGAGQSGRQPASPVFTHVLMSATTNDELPDPNECLLTSLPPTPSIPLESEVIGRSQKRSSGRRMSRSLDILTDHSLMAYQVALEANSFFETTTTTSSTQGATFDDQRTLLAAHSNHNQPRGPQTPLVVPPAYHAHGQPARTRQACMRCRSWSPALFNKLEGCISQIKSKIPRLNQLPSNHHQLVDSCTTKQQPFPLQHTCISCSSDQSSTGKLSTAGSNAALDSDYELAVLRANQSGSGEESQQGLSSDEEDRFGDFEANTMADSGWPLAKVQRLAGIRKSFATKQKSAGSRSKLRRQQSSISDTVSTKTAKTMLTNVGSSFESGANIPASSGVKK